MHESLNESTKSRFRPARCRRTTRKAGLALGAAVTLGILGGGGQVGYLGGVLGILSGVSVCEAQVAHYPPYFGVDVGYFVERALDREGSGDIGLLIVGEVSALDEAGDAWGWCSFAGVGVNSDTADGGENGLRIDFYFEPTDGGRVRFDDIPVVPDGADANDISILRMIDSLDGLVLFPRGVRGSAMIKGLTVGNDRGWIGGSYFTDHDGKVFRPMLFIPNDFDNDGVPDIREILQARLSGGGTELDVNGNWMLDSAENDAGDSSISNMRVGLHGVGFNGIAKQTEPINNVQVVRMQDDFSGINKRMGSPFVFSVLLSGCGTPCECCSALLNNFQVWGDGNSDVNREREVMLTIRSKLRNDSFGGFDHIFDDLNGPDRTNALALSRMLGFRFANAIDYIQFGNESFTGDGAFMFPAGTVINGHTLTSDTTIDMLPGTWDTATVRAAGDMVIDWLAELTEQARIGSALGGRPWRGVVTGMPFRNIFNTSDADPNGCMTDDQSCPAWAQNRIAGSIDQMSHFANLDRLMFDVHTHYVPTDDPLEALKRLRGTSTIKTTNWEIPRAIAMSEWSPKPSSGWWNANKKDDNDTSKSYVNDYYIGHPKNPTEDWQPFFAEWKVLQFEFNGDFQLATGLTDFRNQGMFFVCYGDVLQRGVVGSPRIFDVTAVLLNLFDPAFDGGQTYGPMRAEYESVAAGFMLPNFRPHDNVYDLARSCPTCP